MVVLGGHYSNPLECQSLEESPVQTALRRHRKSAPRLTKTEVNELARCYEQGCTINQLAESYKIHRTTVMDHLKRRNVTTRVVKRRLSDANVAQAAELYAAGQSLATIAARFRVDAKTVHREFRKAEIPTRPRQGRRKNSSPGK